MKAFWNELQLNMIFDFTRKHFEIIKIFNVITGCIDIFFYYCSSSRMPKCHSRLMNENIVRAYREGTKAAYFGDMQDT